MSYLRIQASSLAKVEANWGPRSEITMSCSPNCLNTWLKKSWAILFASMVLEQGARITPFVRPWSTMTINESYPWERGRSVIRSTNNCLNGRVEVDLIEDIGGVMGCVRTLFCWQMEQPVTKLLTYICILRVLVTRSLVQQWT